MGNAFNLAGGLRLTVDWTRGSAGRTHAVVTTLRAIPGVREVIADPRTGSVAVRYEPHLVGGFALGGIDTADTAHDGGLPAIIPRPAISLTRIVETVVVVALEVALQRMLGPFWPKRC